ncbi:Glycosyltransferase, GT2 family [Pseudarcicella hirudinis]|uniref:Glycosyltransferase, GT2 family n=1 Tax=Pseudarcicella hirudinis TaxID=1079859 RepID=A0A1I5YP35_9BACT|nr:glycosyltransferase [Pseudarcicella hirudinis]SFQ45996.1 Glycosyltransferase, GT2 family [Pseudarcicella hirudinis]
MKNRVSVIIATYNRAPLLKETINSLLTYFRQDFIDSKSEIIIIDNNSNDGTLNAVQEYLKESDIVKYYLETNQGLSHARNRGIKESSGDILVFLDDDIDIDKSYFELCDEAFASADVNIIGGKVLPYNVAVPEWLPKEYYYLASIFDLGEQRMEVNTLMGANYAMRKSVADKVGWYDPNLGRKGDLLLGGEENDYLKRAQALNYKILYIPELIVFHKIENKLNKDYIFNHAFHNGKSSSLLESQKLNLRFILKIMKSLGVLGLYAGFGKHMSSSNKKVLFQIKQLYASGYLKGMKTKFSGNF